MSQNSVMAVVDERWVSEIQKRHGRELLGYARGLTKSCEEAEDMVQEVFLRLCRQDPERLGERAREWLYTVCRHLAVDAWRRKGRNPMTRELPDVIDGQPGPESLALLDEDSAQLTKALARLPDPQKEVLRLKFHGGFSYAEIARITGKSVSHVGVTIHVALKALRKDFRKHSSWRTS